MALNQTGATTTITPPAGVDPQVLALLAGSVAWDTTQAGVQGTVVHWYADTTWTSDQVNEIASIFNDWASVAGITFVEVTNASDAEITLTKTTDAIGGYGGYSGVPIEANQTTTQVGETIAQLGQAHVFVNTGAILVNGAVNPGVDVFGNPITQLSWFSGTGFSQAGIEEVTHEIGHALGLKHPFSTGPGSTVVFAGVTPDSSTSLGTNNLDQTLYTLMSYNSPTYADASGTVQVMTTAGPMAYDIAAIQVLYGANLNTNSGDTTYTLTDTNTSGTSAPVVQAIWDTGGIDQIVYNGSNRVMINLNAATLDSGPGGGGYLSYVMDGNGHAIGNGYTIAGDVLGVLADSGTEHGVVIENASGGSGDDIIIGNGADNVLNGNAGDDQLYGGDGNDTLYGGAGNDRLFGGNGNDLLNGGSGNDYLDGGAGSDTVDYSGFLKPVYVNLGTGVATIASLHKTDTLVSVENIIAGRGSDVILGTSGDNTFYYVGHNGLTHDGGTDVYYGNGGNDTIDFSKFGGSVNVDLQYGEASATHTAALPGSTAHLLAYFSQIENVVASYYSDVLYGDSHDNTFTYVGSFTATSNTGGTDTYYGRGGNDTVDFSQFVGNLDVNLVAHQATSSWSVVGPTSGSSGTALIANLSSIENVVTGLGDAHVVGDAGNNVFAQIGSFTPTSDTGGFNTYVGGGGNDTIDFSRYDGRLDVDLAQGYANADYSVQTSDGGIIGVKQIASLTGIENVMTDLASGRYVGDANANTFYYDGTYTAATQTAGVDTFVGGGGSDTIDFTKFNGNLYVSLADGTAQSSYSVTLPNGGSSSTQIIGQLTGISNVTGNNAGDQLIGDQNANVLIGGTGNDRLEGGGGNDTLTGGAGADTFAFKAGFGKDVITDFATSGAAHDVIELQHSMLAQFTNVQALLNSQQVVTVNGNTVITVDANDTITLNHVTKTALTGADILFV